MKVAAITRTMGHTDTVSLMEALSTSCVSFLSALRPKLYSTSCAGTQQTTACA